jgi:hypothetical protein
LHVLSLPLAFILSQDQTLHCNNLNSSSHLQHRCIQFPKPRPIRYQSFD